MVSLTMIGKATFRQFQMPDKGLPTDYFAINGRVNMNGLRSGQKKIPHMPGIALNIYRAARMQMLLV